MKSLAIAILGFGLLSTATFAADTQMTQMTQASSTDSGKMFLEKNKKKPGIILLADGLQYKILKQGKGQKPTDSDTVVVNYEGKLTNGTVFDSSYQRGQPATFQVGGVIPGWTEALKLMKTGSTWELYIPSNLAYGDTGAPPSIGPNETLIFKVDLLAINK